MVVDERIHRRLLELGEAYDAIRAAILTSTRTYANPRLDVFSDYDVVLYTREEAPFAARQEDYRPLDPLKPDGDWLPDPALERERWYERLGPVLVKLELGWREQGQFLTSCLVIYEDGTKIDFGLRGLDPLRRMADEGTPPDDHGYAVLFDKDGLASALPPPTRQAYIPPVPSEFEYRETVNGFWWNSTYAAKYLWRQDLMAVKVILDHHLRQDSLRRVLEWSIELEHDWAWKPGAYGRGLLPALDPQTRQALVDSYAGGRLEDLWAALFATCALFRRVARRVGETLSYAYSEELDRRVTAYHEAVHALDPAAQSPDELTVLLAERLT